MSFDWLRDTQEPPAAAVEDLATERGYDLEKLRERWISRHYLRWSDYDGGRWCFPVVPPHQGVTGCHQFGRSSEGKKRVSFFPKGIGTVPLVWGRPEEAETVFILESQWDAIALSEVFPEDGLKGFAMIITRGASNGITPSNARKIPAGATVYAILQNDEEKGGKVAAEDWFSRVQSECPRVRRVETPPGFEDPQEWLKAVGIERFREDLREAVRISAQKGVDSENSENSENLPAKEEFRESDGRFRESEGAAQPLYNGVSGVSGVDSPSDPDSDPFPLDCLPEAGRQMCEALIDMTGGAISPALPAMGVLGTISAAIGPAVRIESTAEGSEGGTTGANLFLLAGTPSSGGKTFIYKRLTKCLTDYDKENQDNHNERVLPDIESEIEELRTEKNRILKQSERSDSDRQDLRSFNRRLAELEKRKDAPRLISQNATSQALIRLMARQPRECLSSLIDEARDVLDILLGRFTPGNQTDETFYNHAWSGSYYTCDRVTDGVSISMKSPWMSALWFTQPDKLRELLRNPDVFESGYVPRVLMCDTGGAAINLSKVYTPFPSGLQAKWDSHVREILLAHRESDREDSPIVKTTPEALEVMANYAEGCIERMRGDLSDIPTIAGKWGENAWRVALNLHTSEHPLSTWSHPLRESTAKRAVRIVDWFSRQSVSLLAPVREEKEDSRASRLISILSRDKYDPVEGVTYGVLKKSHGYPEEELDAICEGNPRRFEKVAVKASSAGGRPTAKVRLR